MVKDRESWHVAVHGVANSLTWLSEQQETESRLVVASGGKGEWAFILW